MTAELLMQLASSGATTLVASAATDLWQQARVGFARLFGRGDLAREAQAEVRLDGLAAALEEANLNARDTVRERLLPAWQTRLADLLEDDTRAAEILRGLCDELRARLPEPQRQWVQNIVATETGATAQGVMFGNIINYSGPPAGGD